MTDLHTHILPSMDDGAPDVCVSGKLLNMERKQNVVKIALTSHFDCEMESVGTFLNRRKKAITEFLENCDVWDFDIKLGCEVMFRPSLMAEALHQLCIQDTKLMLVELPPTFRPPFFEEFLVYLSSLDIHPLIAHVERYRFVQDDPRILIEWIELGAYTQINAHSLLHNDKGSALALKLVKWNLAHVIATDTHSLHKRPPDLEEAIAVVKSRLGEEKAKELLDTAEKLFEGRFPACPGFCMPKRLFGMWI